MTAGTVSRVLSLIPERTVRTQSGVQFSLEGTNCVYPERLAHVVGFLSWLSPLAVLTRDDQVTLGLVAANGRPASVEDEELEDTELETAELETAELETETEAWDRPEVAVAPVQEAVL